MHIRSVAALIVAASATVNAQTPDQFKPHTDKPLSVVYGNNKIQLGAQVPQEVASKPPKIGSKQSKSGHYILALLDVTIADNSLPSGISGTVPGLGPDQTTYLNWLQTNVTIGNNNILGVANKTAAAAKYGPPQPPRGTPPHTYVFLLFSQPESFKLPNLLASGALADPKDTAPRFSFDLKAITAQKGVKLLEANWMLVQNANNTGAPTPTTKKTQASPTQTGSSNSGSGGNDTGSFAPTSSPADVTLSFTSDTPTSSASSTPSSTASTTQPSSGAAGGHGIALPVMGFGALSAMMFQMIAM